MWVRGELPALNFDDWLALQRRAAGGRKRRRGPRTGALRHRPRRRHARGLLPPVQRHARRRPPRAGRLAPRPARPGARRNGHLVGAVAGRAERPVRRPPHPAGAAGCGRARALDRGRARDRQGRGRRAQSVARHRHRHRELLRSRARRRPARVRRQPAGHRVADRAAGADQRQRARDRAGAMAVRGPRPADEARRRSRRSRRRAGSSRASAIPMPCRTRPRGSKGQLAWAGAPNDFDYPTLSGAFRIEVGPGRFTRIEPGIGQAPRRAFAAVAAAPDHARLHRRLLRGLRLRRDHRRRQDPQRRADDRGPAPVGARGQGRTSPGAPTSPPKPSS